MSISNRQPISIQLLPTQLEHVVLTVTICGALAASVCSVASHQSAQRRTDFIESYSTCCNCQIMHDMQMKAPETLIRHIQTNA